MKFDPPTASARWHPLGCQCDECHPAGPASKDGLGFGLICLLILAGMLAGVPIVAAIDALTTRVGLLSVFES